MFAIQFFTETFRPDLDVGLHLSVDWAVPVPGFYQDGAWHFRLDERDLPGTVELKFVLQTIHWQSGENLSVQPAPGATFAFSDLTFDGFRDFVPTVAPVENGRISRMYFPPRMSETASDIIVVGSGVGGGIIAEQAADRGKKVLLLEAGSYLFPTHVGNIGRRQWISGRPEKNIWSLWHDFKTQGFVNAPGSHFDGGFGINLGGRSIFWGAYIPRMIEAEFAAWPRSVVEFLLRQGGYDVAERLLRRHRLDSPYQERVLNSIGEALPQLAAAVLPTAVGQSDPDRQSVPSGVFSTADLLFEAMLTSGPTGRDNLTVLLNSEVVSVHKVDDDWSVRAFDKIARVERFYRARKVVLAAGSVGSPVIVERSRLADGSGLSGRGLTDHPIYFAHFIVPEGSPYYDADRSVKMTLHHRNASAVDHRWIGILDFGSDWGLSRFIDADTLASHLRARPGMLAELVFQFSSPLVDEHWVKAGAQIGDPALLHITPVPIGAVELAEIEQLLHSVVALVGGVAIPGVPLTMQRAAIGGVAHEAGTLRMGEKERSVVDDQLEFHEHPGLFACDLSVFPSSPAANPTVTLAALAQRLAAYL
ncbi:MAG: GMC oxidoreductase [Sphingobium sp.]